MKLIFIKGIIGNYGTKVLIEDKYKELSKYFNKEFLQKVINDLNGGANPPLFIECKKINFDIFEKSVIDKEKIKKGGLLAALWKICSRNNFGVEYSLVNVPLNQGTIEISNFFDLNPYRLLTENAEIVAIDGDICGVTTFENFELTFDNSDNLLKNSYENNKSNTKNFYYLGKITNNRKRIRIDNDIESYLTKDFKDEVDKVIPNLTKNI